jgi:hypothetical protein
MNILHIDVTYKEKRLSFPCVLSGLPQKTADKQMVTQRLRRFSSESFFRGHPLFPALLSNTYHSNQRQRKLYLDAVILMSFHFERPSLTFYDSSADCKI